MHYLSVFILALILLFLGQWTITKTKKAASTTKAEQERIASVEIQQQQAALAALLDPWSYQECKRNEANTIPADPGYFCATLKKGAPVKIMPPFGVDYEVRVDDPAMIEFIGFNGRVLPNETKMFEKGTECIPRPKDARGLQVTLAKDALVTEGTVRVVYGQGARNPKTLNCS